MADAVPQHQAPGQPVWVYPSEQMFFNAMKRKVGQVPVVCIEGRVPGSCGREGRGDLGALLMGQRSSPCQVRDVWLAGRMHLHVCWLQRRHPTHWRTPVGVMCRRNRIRVCCTIAVAVADRCGGWLQGWDPHADDMKSVVAIHNAVNERAWREVMAWEQLHCDQCPAPKLKKFRGRPNDFSPKARLLNLMVSRRGGALRGCSNHVYTVVHAYAYAYVCVVVLQLCMLMLMCVWPPLVLPCCHC